jgi:hypothetical protein
MNCTGTAYYLDDEIRHYGEKSHDRRPISPGQCSHSDGTYNHPGAKQIRAMPYGTAPSFLSDL